MVFDNIELIDDHLEIKIAEIQHKIHFYKLNSPNKSKSNKTLIILHGALACAEEYIPVAYKLIDFYDAIYLIDMPGFGITTALPNQDFKKTVCSIYLALQKITEIHSKIDIVGHSFGAYVLQETLTLYPNIVTNINKVVLIAIAGIESKLHIFWYDIWRTYFWAFFFKYQIVTRFARFLALYLPLCIWTKLIKYNPKLQLWQNSSEGEKLLANSIHCSIATCAWIKPCCLQVADLSKKLELHLLCGTKDRLFIADIARNFAKKYDINITCVLNATHGHIDVKELKQLLNT
tara:strand:- start:263 stop:1132 length:870 start_codon:yes stop_codon:yes gene_type:complete